MGRRNQLYKNLINSKSVTEYALGTENEFISAMSSPEKAGKIYDNLINKTKLTAENIGTREQFIDFIAPDFENTGNKRKQDNIFSEEYLEQVAEPSVKPSNDFLSKMANPLETPFSQYIDETISGKQKVEIPYLDSWGKVKKAGQEYEKQKEAEKLYRQSIDNETDRIQDEINKLQKDPGIRRAMSQDISRRSSSPLSYSMMSRSEDTEMTSQEDYLNLKTAASLISDAKKTANASKNKSGFWKGVGDSLISEEAVSLGLSSIENTLRIMPILDKVEKEGIQSLTPSENTLLEAASVKSLSDMIYESGLSTLYNVGSATGTSIPYMLQFVITRAPASAIAKPVMKKLTGYVTKRFGEAAIKKAAARAISTLPKVGTKTALKTANALTKTGVAALEAGATGALMPIIQPSMYNDILERRMGQVDADINPQTGKVQYKGQTGEKSWGKSIGEGFTAGAIENLAEMSGGAIMKTLGVPVKALSKVSPKSREFINIISEKPLLRSFNRVREDIAKTTGVHSIPGEALEEFVGQTANALTVGDQKLEDIYTWENAWMTLASVAPLSIGMGSASGVMAQAAKKKVVRDYNRASKKLSEAYSPDLVEYIKSRVGGSPEQQAMIIRQYYDRAREAKNEEEKRNIANEYRLVMDYAAAVNNYDAYIGGIEARVANEVSALSEQIRNDINPDMNATVYIDYDGQMARVTSGNIVFDENGDINDSKSDDTITIELQDGTKQMVSPDKFKVTGYRSFDDQINEATQNIENTILSQEDTDVYGPDPVLDEALYINTDNGPVSVKVTRADYGGFEGIQIDESGKEITEIINGIETPVSIPFSKDQIIRPDNPTIETENNTVAEDARPLQAGDVINVTGFQNPVTFVSESNGDAIVGLLDNMGNPIINTEGKQVQVPVKSEQIIHSQTQSQEIKEETSDSASPVEEEVIPMRKNKKGEQVKDYVSMPDNMFVEHMINDYGNEAAKEGLKDRKRNIDSLINRLKKRRDKSTNTNEKIDIDDEINDLKSRLQILEELSQNLPNEPNSFKERLNSLSEPVSLEDYILQGIASGEYKFKWGGKNGLSDELGLKSDRERRSRIGILKNDGYTPETLAERIFQEIEYGQLPFSVEELEIRNSIIDILNRVHSRKRALEESESLQKEFEDQQIRVQEQNSDVVEELTPEELQEIDEAIAELKPIDDIRFRTKETWTPEEKEIITKAKNNGTYLKAPNSADTNLNPRQWVQVRTKAFKKWFGDWENDSENVSKVVDENGEPMVVYHGTSDKSFFHIFDYNKAGTGNDKGLYSRGFYFSPNKRTADAYRGKEGHVYGVYLQLKNPFYINKFKDVNELADYLNVSETIFYEHAHGFTVSPSFAGTLTSSIKEKGHDGVIVIRKNSDIIQEIVAFNPNQIKSATDNTGEFSINNNDIRFRTNMSSSSENLNNETLNNGNKNTALFNIESINDFAGMTPEQKIVFNAVIDMLKDANIPVEVLTNNQINSLVEFQNSRLMTVYHGSGAKFDAFDHSHIGEGEGAQAYGWGSYVTEVEGIGRTYAESNSGNIFKSGFGDFYLQEIRKGLAEGNQFEDIKQKLLSYHADMYEKAGGNIEMYGDFISDYETLQQLKENDLPKRNLYTVEIPDNTGNNYLVWNEEVNETQKEEIISSLSEIYDEDFDFDYFLDKMDQYEYEYNLTGEGLYKLLSKYGFNNNSQKASNILQQIGYTGISYPAQYRTGGRSDGAKNYVIFNENDLKIKDRISFFKDNKGIIYGATINGEIYLNGSALNPETPIHEYTHIWDYACKDNNPELWNRGIKLMKQTTVWEEVKNDPNYSDLQTDDEIASEVHSRLTGKDSTKLMENIVSKASRKSSLEIVKAISLRENLKKWISDFWWWLKDTMSPWTKNKSSKVSLEDFVNMPLKDLVIGTKLNIKINHKSFKTQNKNNLLNNEDNSLSSQNDQKEKNGTISESIPQRKYRTQASQDRRMEEAASGLRNRIEASTRDAQKNSGTLSKRQQQEIEQRSAESYAKETGQWIPISDTFTWQPMPSGNENDVYLNTNDGHVYKVNNLINSKGIIPLFDRLILHNQTFPESKYEFVGFTGFDNGNIFPVFRQQYVNNATFATPQEIGEYMQSLGFKQTGDAKYSNGDITISDLRPRNVLKDSDGDLYVVDAEFKAENNSRFRFIGEEGATNLDRSEEATTRLDNLNMAREMENAFEEKKARIEKLRNSEPVEITGEEYKGKYELNRDSAQEFILNNLRGSYTIVDTGEKVNLSKVGAKKVTSHSMGNEAHLKSIVAIPQLLGNAIFIEERPNEKRNGKYDSYRYYVTGLKIGNENFTVRLTIGVKNGKYYYDHYLTEIEKGNLIEIANGFTPTGDAPVPSYTVGEDTRLISLLQTNNQENARKIKLATGWERGADGKWQHDTEAKLQIPKEEKINEIKRLSDILNTEVEIYDTQADLPTNIREKANGEISGYYMPGNDKVAIVLDANISIGDIQATMLHEIVGHKGIRGLFGNRTDEFLDKVFESMDANVRAEYMERFNSERLAAEEYLSELAEYNPETSGIKKIIAIIRDFFREILGIDLKLSDNDIVYILSKSRERLQNSRNLSENKPLNESYSPNEESNLTNTKISEELKHIQQETEETLYRLKYPVKVDVSGDSAIEAAEKISGAQYLQRVIDKDIYRNISYNTLNRNAIQAVGYGRKKLRYFDKRKMENAYKGLFDNMNDLHNLQKTIIDTYGSIDDSLNAYYAENASSSRAQDRTNRFQVEYEQPLINTLAKIRKKFNNDDFMMKYYPSVRTIIERQKVITDREIKKAQNDPKIKDDRQSLFAAIQLAEKKDYAGQTGTYKEILAHEYPEFKFPANFETMTYDEVKDFAKENNLISMEDFVERSENILGNDLVNEFWNNVRKISQYKLYNDYQTGMISRDMFEELTYGVTMKELAKKRLDAGEIKQEQYDLVLNTFNRPESLLSRGIITKDQYNSLKPRYEYYLPLKGTSDVEADDINEYNNKKVKNISALKAVEGHENVARDPLPQLLQDVYGSIMSQEQNRWRNTLLNMLRKYPMPDLYHIQTEYFTPIRNEKGNIIEYVPYVKIVNDKLIFVPTDEELKAKTAIRKRKGLDLDIEINKRQSSEHTVTFLENGDYVTVYFTDPRIAQSINNLNVNTLPTFLDSIMKWGGKINRFRSQFMTTANPEFVIANVIKDFQEANSNILIKEGLKYWKEFNKIYLNPELGAAIRRRLNGKKGDTEIDKYVDEFFKYGGETAYNMLPGYEQKRKDLYKEIKKVNKEGNKAILVGSKVKDWAKDNLEMLNKQAELRARIATYVTSRKHTKREISRSIWDAKEITVNFDKKGSWAKGFGFWQLFWNAGRQSNRMQIQMIKTHPIKWAIVKSVNTAIGFAETVLPWLILDDDDRKNYLDKYFSITPYLRYSNLIMGFGGELVTIPLPPAFIPSHTLGVCMAEMVLKNNEPGFDPTALVIDVANAGANEWLPEFIVDPVFDIANRKDFVISSIVPAQLKPFAEIYDNRNFFGSPIYNDNINEFKPAYQRIYNGTGPTYVNISQTLNNWTGGNEVDRGFIQLNPAILEHLVEGYVSGLGKFGEKAFTTLSGNAESSKDIPVLGRFWRGDIEYYLDRDEKNTYYRLLKQAEEYRYRRNEYRKLNGYESEKEELKKEGELYEPILIQIRKLNRYKRLEKNTSDPKKKEKYKNKQNEVYKKVQQIEEEYNNKKFNQ